MGLVDADVPFSTGQGKLYVGLFFLKAKKALLSLTIIT
jgi:hypothetical protein